MRDPLVSCIMPTYRRRAWVPLAIRCWQEQDYARRELVIVDDGPEPCGDVVREAAGEDERVRYVHLHGRSSIGEKLNFGVRMARGDLLALWADDDYHAAWRLRYQTAMLLAGMREGVRAAEICGCDSIHYWSPADGGMWRYSYIAGQRSNAYVVGGTMLFTRRFWQAQPFDGLWASGEDTRFIAGRGPLLGALDNRLYLATMHAGNTSPKELAMLEASDNWTRTTERPEDLAAAWWLAAVERIMETEREPCVS